MSPVRYHESAEEELLCEIAYLEGRAPGLGRRFFGEVQRAETLIQEFAEAAPEISSGIRKRQLQRFRYSLIYSVLDDGCLSWQ